MTERRAGVEFLAELYLPALDKGAHRAVIRKAERTAAELAREGARIRFVHSVFVPTDEICFLLFEADSAETVLRLAANGRLSFDRVVEAIS